MTESDGALPHVAVSNERMDARSWRITGGEVRDAVVLVMVLGLVGLLVGLVWAHVAPRALYTVVDVKQRLAQQNDVESEAQIGVDGWFALIGAGVGLVTGVLAWRGRSARGPFYMVMIAAGSLLGAVIAWRFGLWVGRHPTQAQLQPIFDKVGNTFRPPIKMRAKAVLFFQPAAAVIGALVSFLLTKEERQRRRELKEAQRFAKREWGGPVDEGYEPLERHTSAWVGEAWPTEHKRLVPFVNPEQNAPTWFVTSPWPSLSAEQAARLVAAYVPAENTARSKDTLQEVLGWSDEQAYSAFDTYVAGRFND